MTPANYDPQRVPKEIVQLLPMAERWGIADDFERELEVRKASMTDLRGLAECLDLIEQDSLSDWLCGSESYATKPTKEYIAITCLTMAVESAKLRLRALESG